MLQTHRVRTLDQVRSFLDGAEPVEVRPLERSARYEFVAQTLRRFGYWQPGKADKGVARRFAGKVSGLSRAQLTRLIAQHRSTGHIRDRRGPPRRPFPRRYTREDIRLLAQVDALHGTLSGPATRKLCERAYTVFHDPRFERLAGISNGHLYNLRHSTTYQRRRGKVAPTRPTKVSIGERRRPHPQGRPGFVRVDTVHQGDFDGAKGLYHLNLVDEVTQFQFIGSCERITERFLVPVLEGLLGSFPFTIEAFHADNGSEFINHQVARLLNKLHIGQFTKSRARRTNDNALVESKNASVVRKHFGYAHLPARFAPEVNRFAQHVLSPYLNFHRPCHFPTEVIDPRGRVRKRYRYQDLATPYEKLKSLPDAQRYLTASFTFERLDELACALSDNDAARQLNEAREQLFQSIHNAQATAA